MATNLGQVTSAQTYTARRVMGGVLTCLALVVGATLFGVVGSIIGIMAASVTVGAVVRTVLIMGVMSIIMMYGYRLALGGPRPLWLLSGLAAYVLLPSAWSGKAMIATAFGLTGVTAWAVDALVWTAVVVLVVRSRDEVHDDRIDTSGLR